MKTNEFMSCRCCCCCSRCCCRCDQDLSQSRTISYLLKRHWLCQFLLCFSLDDLWRSNNNNNNNNVLCFTHFWTIVVAL